MHRHQSARSKWGPVGHRCRDFRKLIIPKTKAPGNDLQIMPLNEAQPLEFVEKRLIVPDGQGPLSRQVANFGRKIL